MRHMESTLVRSKAKAARCFEGHFVVSRCLLCFPLHFFHRSLCSFGHALLAAPSLIVFFSHCFLFIFFYMFVTYFFLSFLFMDSIFFF